MNPAGHKQILAFLKEVDMSLAQPLTFYLFGGAAITLAYDHENRTFDLDLVDTYSQVISSFGPDSKVAQKYHVYLSDLPEINLIISKDWRLRTKILDLGFKFITLKVADPYDIFVSKLPRLEPKDLEDMQSLVEKGYIEATKLLKILNQNLKEVKNTSGCLNNVKLAFQMFFSKTITVKSGRLIFA
ncbi:MAG: hypothetical protein HYS07_00110 [Chlamydiae bacterium]|nr:hypothetical protein [Chlamydiota bacterium]MBI3276311.1 hypothetical protein [Chlamydiota bacterium]